MALCPWTSEGGRHQAISSRRPFALRKTNTIVLYMRVKKQHETNHRVSQSAYQRVRHNVLEMIRDQHLQPGDRLPPEQELANRLGLSHLTVRKGLAMLVREQVIERRVGAGTFLRAIPGAVSSSLDAGPAATNPVLVGILTFPQADTFTSELLGTFHVEAERRGLQLAIRTVSDLSPKIDETVRQMAAHGCFSILLPGFPEGFSLADLNRLIQKAPVPVVLSKPYPGLEANSFEQPGIFGRADYLAIEMACEYLHRLDYGHIAFLGPDSLHHDVLDRRTLAYSRFMSRHDLETMIRLATAADARDVNHIVKGWAPLAGDLAVICYDDDFAIRLMTALHRADLRIPEDVAVLGFNNIPLGLACDPPLSTIQFDYGHVARGMLDHALAASGRPPAAPPEEIAHETLVIRASCGGRLRHHDRLSQIIAEAQAVWIRPPRGITAAPLTQL